MKTSFMCKEQLFMVAVAVVFALQLNGQTHWSKHPDNPLLLPGAAGEWDEMGIASGSVLFHNNTYHMWYNNRNFEVALTPGIASIGYATSDDGIHWTKYPGNPVLESGPVGSWDENLLIYPFVMLKDGVFHMWYMGHSGILSGRGFRLGYASSSNGINWTKYENNPVLSEGPAGSWDDTWVGRPSVVYVDSVFHMWYMGWDGPGNRCITGHATSANGVDWTKDTLNPVLTTGTWDSPRSFPGPVIFDGSTFHMWYGGGHWPPDWKSGYATSQDGSHWIKYPGNPVLDAGPAGAWDSKHLEASAVLYDSTEGRYMMWYSGTGENGKEKVGYAESYETAWQWLGAHRGGPSCLVDSAIYVFSSEGSGSWTISPDVNAYNPVTGGWKDFSSMPVATTGGSMGVIGDKIYLVGGWKNQSPTSWVTVNSILEYDPGPDSWRQLEAAPVKMGSAISCVKDSLLYLFGGLQQSSEDGGYIPRTSQAWTYDPVREIWDSTSLPPMPFPHVMHGSAEVLDGSIYVLSGVGPGPEFEIQPPEKFDGETWEPIADMPVPVVLHSSLVHDHKILVFGGDSAWSQARSFSTNLIQEYDPASDSWRLMEPMPFQRAGMAGEKVGDYLYLIGGYAHDREPSTAVSEVWRYHLDSLKEWVVPCSGVLINLDSLELPVDSSYALTAKVQPSYVADSTVLWSSDNESVASVSSDGIVTAKAPGETRISASAHAGGCLASCQVVVLPGVGMAPQKADRIRMFPNPTKDQISIQTDFYGSKWLEITTMNGQLIFSKSMEGITHEIDLTPYRRGVYFLTIHSRDFVTTRKIIKL